MVLDLLFLLSLVPVLVLWALARTKGRRWSGAWLLTLAPLYLPMGEDGFLAIWYALATPSLDPHGIRGLVERHSLGHVMGAGVSTILLGVVLAYIARRHLVRGEAWAYRVLFASGVVVVAVAFLELGLYYGHGLPSPVAGAASVGPSGPVASWRGAWACTWRGRKRSSRTPAAPTPRRPAGRMCHGGRPGDDNGRSVPRLGWAALRVLRGAGARAVQKDREKSGKTGGDEMDETASRGRTLPGR